MERFVARTADRKYKNRDCRNYPITVDGLCDFLGFGASNRHVRGWVRARVAGNGYPALTATESTNIHNSENTDNSNPLYGTIQYNVELHIANDRDLYNTIRNFMDRHPEPTNPSLLSSSIKLLVLRWNRDII